jgi:hypothetical protein
VENLNARGGKADELREPQNITGKPAVDAEKEPEPEKAAPMKPPPFTPPAEDSEQARAIAQAAAARLLRKEMAAVQKYAVKHASDEDAFVVAVTEFYVAHIELVSLTLQMTPGEAEAYCAGQANQVCNGDWVEALTRWKTDDYAAGLAGLALDREIVV